VSHQGEDAASWTRAEFPGPDARPRSTLLDRVGYARSTAVLNGGQAMSTSLDFGQKWRRRESNPCEGSEQKREKTWTSPPNPRNRLDKSLPFDPAPSHLVPTSSTESGHKEGTKLSLVHEWTGPEDSWRGSRPHG